MIFVSLIWEDTFQLVMHSVVNSFCRYVTLLVALVKTLKKICENEN